MTDISFNPTSVASKGHQSIGADGSFWLPPKMKAAKFGGSPKQFSDSLNSTQAQPSQDKSNVLSQGQKSKLSFLPEASFTSNAKGTRPGSIKPHPKTFPPDTKGDQNGMSSKVLNSALPVQINDVSRVNLIQPNPSLIHPQNPLGMVQHSSGNHISLNKTNKDRVGEKVDLLNGTGIAPRYRNNDDAFFQTPLDSSSDFPSKPLSDEEFVEAIQGFLSQSPFSLSHNKRVTRFALSLENGSSVSVRIEQMKEKIEICFISEDSSSLLSLSSKFKETEFDSPIEMHFFTSYKQMDKTLPRTIYNND